MKKPHVFRPSLADVLEDRVVLSHAHAHVVAHAQPAPFNGIDLASIQNQINAAFANFALDYSQAQSGYVAPSSSTTPETYANLQSFVGSRVSTLVQQINGIISSMPRGSATIASSLTGPLAGTNVGTLQQQLQAITPIGTNGQTAATFTQQAAAAIELGRSVTAQSFQIFGNLANMDLYSQYQSQFTQNNRHQRLSKAQQRVLAYHNQLNSQIQQTFSNFLNGFTGARNSVLFNTGTGTSAGTSTGNALDLTANQAQFNSQLTSGLINFSTKLSGLIGGFRGAGTSLQPSIVSSIFGSGANNPGLFGQLTSFQAPTDLSGLSAQQFNNQAFSMLNNAYQNIQGRLNVFQTNPTFNFAPFNQIPTNLNGPFYQSNGFFSPPTGQTNGGSSPFFNGGFMDNNVNVGRFSNGIVTGPTFANGFGLNGFNTFFGGGSNFGNGFGGSLVNGNPNSGFGGSNIGSGFGGSLFGTGTGFTSNTGGFGGSPFGNGTGFGTSGGSISGTGTTTPSVGGTFLGPATPGFSNGGFGMF